MRTPSSAEERQARIAEVRKLYEQSRMSYTELSRLTGIKLDTIASWFTTKKPKAPLASAVKYIRMCLEEYFFVNQNGGDVIRHLGNEQLGDFLNDFCANALNSSQTDTNGEAATSNEYITNLVEGTELLKKIIITEPYNQPVENNQDACEAILEIYENSGLSRAEFAEKLEVPLGTVLHWFRKESVPYSYMLRYVQMVFPTERTCGDIIRHMSNAELINFLTDIYNAALNANGSIDNLPSKYRNFCVFVDSEQTEQLKPRLTMF